MNPIAREWMEKAEGDFATAMRESRVTASLNYDAVCFHAQQCAEKYLKAVLQEAGIAFGKTHHLVSLLDSVLAVEATWASLRADMQALTVFAVAYRYPGESADESEARDAMNKCESFRRLARQKLNLPIE